jgi:hypothetical protein
MPKRISACIRGGRKSKAKDAVAIHISGTDKELQSINTMDEPRD